MKIGFFGTPEIASFCLDRLGGAFEIAFVVTGEDKPAGRNQKLRFNPVKELSLQKGYRLIQPARLKDEGFLQEIKTCQAEIFVVVAYGKLIPPEVFNAPPFRTINLHPSLLPLFRGAAPIPWALIQGEHETGITVQLINERLDAGDILLQKPLPLDINMTAGDLYDRVLPLGADMLIETIKGLASGIITPRPQEEERATYCGKINRDTARIDWKLPAEALHNLVRGLNPKPVAWTTFREKNMRIWKTALPGDCGVMSAVPGELIRFQKKRLLAGTGGGMLEILGIQPETKKEMDGLAFLNGYRLEPGERFV